MFYSVTSSVIGCMPVGDKLINKQTNCLGKARTRSGSGQRSVRDCWISVSPVPAADPIRGWSGTKEPAAGSVSAWPATVKARSGQDPQRARSKLGQGLLDIGQARTCRGPSTPLFHSHKNASIYGGEASRLVVRAYVAASHITYGIFAGWVVRPWY